MTNNIRYGIGEWYGKRFAKLSVKEKINLVSEVKSINKVNCPFKPNNQRCHKKGGICTLALYESDKNNIVQLSKSEYNLITVCPSRFWESNAVFKHISEKLLNYKTPSIIKEVGFLKSLDAQGKKSSGFVGRIDMVLAKIENSDKLLDWCALEMQAVYFSGPAMSTEFKKIQQQPDSLHFPTANRRPDFRSSGPKRLMPQLQIKVPTLRRWGKKMAVVVDKAFFDSIAQMNRETHISNADIVWFVVGYTNNDQLTIVDEVYTTLESSVKGLTAGVPVDKDDFESELINTFKIRKDKLITIRD